MQRPIVSRALAIALRLACGLVVTGCAQSHKAAVLAMIPQVEPGRVEGGTIAVSPDKKIGAAATVDGRIFAWDRQNGQLLRIVAPHSRPVVTVAFVGPTSVVSLGEDGRMCWSDFSGSAPPRCRARRNRAYTEAVVSHDGRFLMAASNKAGSIIFKRGWLEMWDLHRNKRLRTIRALARQPVRLEVSADGQEARFNWSGGEKDAWRVCDTETGRIVERHRADKSLPDATGAPRLPGGVQPKKPPWAAGLADELAKTDFARRTAKPYDAKFSSDSTVTITGKKGVWEFDLSRAYLDRKAYLAPPENPSQEQGDKWYLSRSGPQTVESQDGRYRAVATSIEAETTTSKRMRKLKNKKDRSKKKYFFLDSVRANQVLVQTADGQPVGELDFPSPIGALAFSPNGKYLLIGDGVSDQDALELDHYLRYWDIERGREVWAKRANPDAISAVAVSPDGRWALSAGAGATTKVGRRTRGNGIMVWDTQSGERRQHLQGHSSRITSVAFSPNGKLVVSTSRDGTVRIWRVEDGESVAIVAADDEWLLYTDDGIFDASRTGHELVAAVKGTHPFGIDQLAPRNNRPDLLLERLGTGDPRAIEHFRARHQRRLRKLGLEEEKLSSVFDESPTVTIDSVEVAGTRATVTATLYDPRHGLLRYNIYANGVPLFGALGKTTSGKTQQIREEIGLTGGANRIEVSATNAAGIESPRAFRSIEQPAVRGDLYFLAFGVSRYSDERLNLRYAHQDALDLGRAFENAGAAFNRVHSRVYVDDQVTAASIRGAKEFLAPATINDTVVLFVAGHGTHSQDAHADYYFVTHETDVRRLEKTAVKFELIEELLADIAPRRKLFLMDTCESGERDEEDGVSGGVPIAEGGRGLTARTTRALVYDAGEATAGAPPARPRSYLLQRDRYIYNDLSRRTGAVVLSSSRGSEFSYELGKFENGVFTEGLLRALERGTADKNGDQVIDVKELQQFVTAFVATETGDRQHPTVDRDNRMQTIRLPAVEGTMPAATDPARPDTPSAGKERP